MVLTGVHLYQRMLNLPGPRGWFLVLLFLLAAVCMPIWVSFHCGVLGNFTAWVTGTKGALNGGINYLCGRSHFGKNFGSDGNRGLLGTGTRPDGDCDCPGFL